MRLRPIVFFCSCVVLLMGAGCSKVKFYAVDRPRVDQANMGNAGYVGGEKKYGETIDGRQTRRIYVFEVDRKNKPDAAVTTPKAAAPETAATSASQVNESVPAGKQGLSLPYIGDDEPAAAANASAENISTEVTGTLYTVVKDDTLQKISKKVYGAYGKWTKIYDANKDKIKNPNFVKPGTVIVIPPVD